MAEPSPVPGTGDHTSAGPVRQPAAGPPRWVKVFAAIALIVIVTFVVALLGGGGDHGPGRHTPSGNAADLTVRSSVAESPMPPAGGAG